MGTRALIVGLDGAEWSVLEPLLERGQLPNLQRLMDNGASGPLNSTTPPMTLPSWSSMLTGCTPGTHGIFDFVQVDTESKPWKVTFSNSTHRAVPTLFEWLSLLGKQVASIAVPTTWPPYPINGVMISGFDSPVSTGIDGTFCHPPEIYSEIVEKFGGLNFADFQESDIDEGWLDRALDLLLQEIARKEKISSWLLQQRDWDCFMVLFGESDTVSHHFWRFHDAKSPRHDRQASQRHKEAIASVYIRLDQALGRLLEVANAEVICVCSDHGFGGAGEYALFLNRFLEEKGWLVYRPQLHSNRSKMLDWLRVRGLSSVPASLQGPLFRWLPKRLKEELERSSRFGNIDFAQSQAISEEMNYAATIRLNLPRDSGVDRERVIQSLREDLLGWTIDGAQVVERVQTREELYPQIDAIQGAQNHLAPDLVLTLKQRDGYTYTLLPSVRAEKGVTHRKFNPEEYQGGKGLGMNGSHRQHGVLIFAGTGVQAGKISANMEDIAPTLLCLLGIPIPTYMEGRILRGITQQVREPLNLDYTPKRQQGWREPSGEEREAIRQRLQKLGYL